MGPQFVQDVLGRFDQLSEQEIGAIENEALLALAPEEERSLLYAMRVSRCVPTLRSFTTLASRWNVANQGAADSGLLNGRASPNWQAVHDKLAGLFLAHFDKLAEQEVASASQRATGSTSPSIRDRALRKVKDEIGTAFAEFRVELPGLAERADHWLRMLDQVSPQIQGLEANPHTPESTSIVAERSADDTVIQEGAPSRVEVDVVHAQTLNFAMEQSGVPIVAAVHIRNRGSEPATNLTFSVALGPDLGESVTVPVPSLRGGEDTDLGPIDIRLPPGRLRAILEAERARLHWTLRSGDRALSTREIEIDLLAYNEWPGARAPSCLLAVFVTPNHPVVTRLLQRVRDRLSEQTGDGSISGYQKGTKGSVLAQVKALYSALQSLGLSYVGTPASFEKDGQKIRLPDVVLDSQMGNCLDLAVLFASCMEQMGLAPLLVIVRGHAFPGVWLIDDRFPEGVIEDAARVRNQLALGQVLVFDSSTSVAAGRHPLEVAVAEAQKYLAVDDAFVFALDVRVARSDRYRPLPIRMTVNAPGGEEVGADANREGVRTVLQEALAEPEPVEEKEPGPPPTTVVARFQRWKERLLDTSLRNRLLNFRRGGSGAIPLRIPNLPGFEDLLAANNKFELLPRPAQDSRDSRSQELLSAREDDRETRDSLLSEMNGKRLHTTLLESELLPRAKNLYRQARTDLEEGGANTLFAALGILKWFEADSSEDPRFAPLVLYPIHLDYEPRTRRMFLAVGEDDPVGNVTLVEKMRADFGLDLEVLVDLERDEEGIDVPLFLRKVREGIQRMPRWEVLEEVHLGLFTFAKYLMWRDLDENAQVLLDSSVVRHIAEGGNTPLADPVGTVREEGLDDQVPPVVLPTVVDADSTQLAAVCATLRGRSFVLQGPPGTGKSQTITNVIAATLAAGRTVLFVSEKMAALEVVHRRLQEARLDDFCLELHSNKANKKQVLESLRRSLDRSKSRSQSSWEEKSETLAGARAKLNGYVRALHAPRPLGSTFFHASARALALRDAPLVDLTLPDVMEITKDRLGQLLEAVDALAVTAKRVEPVETHPWRASELSEWSGAAENAIRESLRQALSTLTQFESSLVDIVQAAGSSPEGSLDAVESFAALAASITKGPIPKSAVDDAAWPPIEGRVLRWLEQVLADETERTELLNRWNQKVFDWRAADVRALYERHARTNALLAWFALRNAKKQLRSFAKERLPGRGQIALDLARIEASQEKRKALVSEMGQLSAALGGVWSAALENRPQLQDLISRVRAIRKAHERYHTVSPEAPIPFLAYLGTDVPQSRRELLRSKAQAMLAGVEQLRASVALVEERTRTSGSVPSPSKRDYSSALRGKLDAWFAALPRLREWCHYHGACTNATQSGLGAVVEAHRKGQVLASSLHTCTERSILEKWVEAVRDSEPALRGFDGDEHSDLVRRFREQDRGHILLAREHVASLIDAHRPANAPVISDNSEPGILQRELRKQRRHMALRKLFQRIPNLLPRLKPCLLMSPLSVAQYLPAGGRRFDLVVFDEASQIGTHDAIGAIARGEQVVIVGDSKQLPPTTFFCRDLDSNEENPNDNDIEELESILDEAVASQIPQQSLGWHYRSRHESLIEFSNRHYYESRLHVFPSARGRVEDLGIKWMRVPDGVYEKGRTRTNPREAKVLVDFLVSELRRTSPGARTFGVVTFSLPQQTLVLDLLDEARASFPEIEGHFSQSLQEPVFVKNLENVQGDERDEILFSVCYGPNEEGQVYMNFGPLNRTGGERRLNVAITRARSLLRVFSTLTHDMVDLTRTQATGARHLRAFLQYAAEQGSPEAIVRGSSSTFDSDFEREVYDALVRLGYNVECQVGCGAYRIDLAVRHPSMSGVFVLGVECDGASYHSGATARDRDRLRQQVLKNLGWNLHRIWSSDWWFNRDREVEKLQVAVERALSSSGGLQDVPSVPSATVTPSPTIEPVRIQAVIPALQEPQTEGPPTRPYVYATLKACTSYSEALFARAYRPDLLERIMQVVDVEAPLHIDNLARSVAACFGWERVTHRVRAHCVEAVQGLERHGLLRTRGDFIWPQGKESPNLGVIRVAAPGDEERDLSHIPLEELATAAQWHLSHALSIPYRDLARATARTFGIQSLGKRVDERMREVIETLVSQGMARTEVDRVQWLGA